MTRRWASAGPRARRAGCRRRGRPCARARCGWPSRCAGRRAGWGRRAAGRSGGSGSGSVTSSAAAASRPSRSAAAQRGLVDEPAARGVDEDRVRAQRRERVGVDEVPRRGRQRRVQRDDVGLGERGVEVVVAPDGDACASRSPPRGARPRAPMRPGPTIASVAPWTSRPSQPPGSHVRQRPSRTARVRLGQAARGGEDQREGEVGGRVGEHVGRDADRDAARAGLVEVDVVGADRVVGDRAQARRGVEQRGVDAVGEQAQQALGPRHPRAELRRRGRQLAGPHVDVVRGGQAVEGVAGQAAGDEAAGHRAIVLDAGFRSRPRG